MQAEVARAPFVGAVRTACLQQVGEHGSVQAPGGLPARALCTSLPFAICLRAPHLLPGAPRQPGPWPTLSCRGQ